MTQPDPRPGSDDAASGRFARFVGLDDPWARPAPRIGAADGLVAAGFFVFGVLGLELIRSYAQWTEWKPRPVEYLALLAGTVPLVWRRRRPLLVGVLSAAYYIVVYTMVPELGFQISTGIAFFFALFSAVAWARQRRLMVGVVVALLITFFVWIAWDLAYGSAVQSVLDSDPAKRPADALFPALPAFAAWSWIVNLTYLAGAVLLGQSSWRQARTLAYVEEQSQTIERQAATLRERAVTDERLRIARELHDVVAHHVSVMGVQAAAARRVLQRDPDAAASALATVEESSRTAVAEMRGLLGTLRGSTGGGSDHREPEPTAAQIAGLVASFDEPGFAAAFHAVEDVPGAVADLPLPVGLSLYRTVQEALTNVRRHSTARSATVTVRVARESGRRFAEAEILDDGRPRAGTSGSGLGHLGMRERINLHGGTAEIGPRLTGGYRVRLRFPLPEEAR